MSTPDHQQLAQVSVTGLRAVGYHGVLPEERESGQPFIVDVTMTIDVGRATASDDIADAVDYSRVAQLVVDEIQGEPCNLIETLATRIVEVVCRLDRVQSATVVVHKPQAPIRLAFDDVTVTVSRGGM